MSDLDQSDVDLFNEATIDLGSTEIKVSQLISGAELEFTGSTQALGNGRMVMHLDPAGESKLSNIASTKSSVWIVSVDDGRAGMFFEAVVDYTTVPISVSADIPPLSGRYFAVTARRFDVPEPVVNPPGPIPAAPPQTVVQGCEFLVTPAEGGASEGIGCPASLVFPSGAILGDYAYISMSETDLSSLPAVELPGAIPSAPILVEAITAGEVSEELRWFDRAARLCIPYDPQEVNSVLNLIVLMLDEPSNIWLPQSTVVEYLDSEVCTYIARTGI